MIINPEIFAYLINTFPDLCPNLHCRVKQFPSVYSADGKKPKYDTTVFIVDRLWIKIEDTEYKYMDIQDPNTGFCIYSRDTTTEQVGTWVFHGSYEYNPDVIAGVVLSIIRRNKVLHLKQK